jgi:hypothetical protein
MLIDASAAVQLILPKTENQEEQIVGSVLHHKFICPAESVLPRYSSRQDEDRAERTLIARQQTLHGHQDCRQFYTQWAPLSLKA